MEQTNQSTGLLPPALLAEVEALAVMEHRTAREMLREAVEQYLQDRRPVIAPQRTSQEAAARMLELRKGHVLPEGMTIRDLMTYGRA